MTTALVLFQSHTFNNKVHLFEFVLAHITTEHPASALASSGVTTVNGAPPHVADSISINLCRERVHMLTKIAHMLQ